MRASKLNTSQWWVLRAYLVMLTGALLFGASWSYEQYTDGPVSYWEGLSFLLDKEPTFNELMLALGPALCMFGAGVAILLFTLSIPRKHLALVGGLVTSVVVVVVSFLVLGAASELPNLPGARDYASDLKANVLPVAGISGAVFVWLLVCQILQSRR